MSRYISFWEWAETEALRFQDWGKTFIKNVCSRDQDTGEVPWSSWDTDRTQKLADFLLISPENNYMILVNVNWGSGSDRVVVFYVNSSRHWDFEVPRPSRDIHKMSWAKTLKNLSRGLHPCVMCLCLIVLLSQLRILKLICCSLWMDRSHILFLIIIWNV